MPRFLSRLKGRENRKKQRLNLQGVSDSLTQKPKWDDAYTRPSVEPEEIHDLLHICTAELKARGLDIPFLLLPYRPTSNPSAVRTFIRRFFDDNFALKGDILVQELRMTEPMVISGVVKWCWSRISGGVVGWDAYELFKIGESDSRMARDSFKTFIPLSVESGARQRIIFDFFELTAAIVAHGKINGFGGRQLPRMAAWWAFEQRDTGSGFDGGYRAWQKAANATTHLFFAYLRSLTPEEGLTGITLLPRSLEKLLNETEYPPRTPAALVSRTNKLVMLVDTVSPTPFALLRRAGHFQYRDSDPALQQFSDYDDPVQALTEECLRVLRAISAANESQVSSVKHSTSLRDASWSRFEDIGFAGSVEEEPHVEDSNAAAQHKPVQALRSTPASGTDFGRPTTPSWADFLSSGFVDENGAPSNVILPPDKVLPPIETQIRQQSSQSHRPRLENTTNLQPGELASIAVMDLDNAFWWVWMNSLAPEETSQRKSAFGRCAVIETKVAGGSWLVMEEMIAGAAPEPDKGAYIAEKKGLFSWTKRGRSMGRRKSVGKPAHGHGDKTASNNFGSSKTTIGPETHAKVQAKAAQMRAVKENEQLAASRRGRTDETTPEKTTSVLFLQPSLAPEAISAMRWTRKYDKGTIKDAYMANNSAGRGIATSSPTTEGTRGVVATNSNGHIGDKKTDLPIKDNTPVAMVPTPPPKPEVKQADPQTTEPAVEEVDPPVPAPKDTGMPVTPVAHSVPDVENHTPGMGTQKGAFQADKEKLGLRRKLLKRKNRASKVPESASSHLENTSQEEEGVAERSTRMSDVAESPAPEEAAPVDIPVRESHDTPEPSRFAEVTREARPAVENIEPIYDPSAGTDLSPIDADDAAEAKHEFARFDQGPLADQPAFVPNDDDATPPIARYPMSKEGSSNKNKPQEPVETLSQSAGPGVQDRWAQIRKNAAQRAAGRAKDDIPRPKTTSGDDDDTSAEETIESRVARIKARVAELTGNMETGNGSQLPLAGRS
ncbi:uncharacterized protein MAM_05358 [Metarhizium album ARSEF 1941]|uniref:Meiotically up-regulated protein Msb1/Mug8 domain-containing protein n=1 Tax=Metarhizium album (strain ARSEF 1941) TaxID=1081103 RepID=A0A0B2WTL3_METAS|nr:uncharacterized protein MAM_05358 [Metarhizium album ARSEF 1941]KHN96802.1 hypothetical protein MAM_05358 [Metarhizium album ARSEF 1941]